MAYKSVFTVVSNAADIENLAKSVLPFVEGQGAHLDVLCLAIDPSQTGYYFAGATALVHDETFERMREEAGNLQKTVEAALKSTDIAWDCEAIVAQPGTVSPLVAERARFSDVVLLRPPYQDDSGSDAPAILEAALFGGHVPVLLAPVPVKAPHRAIVAWNQSPEAMQAVRAALPLLQAARSVDVLIIDPAKHQITKSDPGSSIARMLSRHGCNVSVVIEAQTLPRVSDMIERHIDDTDADLLVMGAYGHSRLREAILGGATRHMLERAKIPVLLKH